MAELRGQTQQLAIWDDLWSPIRSLKNVEVGTIQAFDLAFGENMPDEYNVTTRILANELMQQENQQYGKRVVAYDDNNNRYIVTGWIEGTKTDPELALTITKVEGDVQPLGKRVMP